MSDKKNKNNIYKSCMVALNPIIPYNPTTFFIFTYNHTTFSGRRHFFLTLLPAYYLTT